MREWSDGMNAATDGASLNGDRAMFSAWMQRLETLFVAVTFAEAGEFETALQIAYGSSAVDARPQA
jgi:hypothetical protein